MNKTMNTSLIQCLFCTFKYASEGQVEVKVKFCFNFDEKSNISPFRGKSRERFSSKMFPASEKSRSEHTLEAGIDKYCLASCNMRGNEDSCCFHQINGFRFFRCLAYSCSLPAQLPKLRKEQYSFVLLLHLLQ